MNRNLSFKIMIICVVVIALLAMLSVSVSAQSYYHEMEIRLDGDYKIVTDITLPDADTHLDLEGVGQAYIKSKLIIIPEDASQLTKWWDLF